MNESKHNNRRPTPKSERSPIQESQDQHGEEFKSKKTGNKPEVSDSAPAYQVSLLDVLQDEQQENESTENSVEHLSASQQQFVLKFCSQLASVIEACEQSESAEIEVGRRQIKRSQIKVKLQAERELTLDSNNRINRQH